jgi:hypothetical protein
MLKEVVDSCLITTPLGSIAFCLMLVTKLLIKCIDVRWNTPGAMALCTSNLPLSLAFLPSFLLPKKCHRHTFFQATRLPTSACSHQQARDVEVLENVR